MIWYNFNINKKYPTMIQIITNPDMLEYIEKNNSLFKIIESYVYNEDYNQLVAKEMIQTIKKQFPLENEKFSIRDCKYSDDQHFDLSLQFPDNKIEIRSKLKDKKVTKYEIEISMNNEIHIDYKQTQIRVGLVKLESEFCDYRIIIDRANKQIELKDYLFDESELRKIIGNSDRKDENNTQIFLKENFEAAYNQIRNGSNDLKDINELKNLLDDQDINAEINLFVNNEKFRNILIIPEIIKLEKKNIFKKIFKL